MEKGYVLDLGRYDAIGYRTSVRGLLLFALWSWFVLRMVDATFGV
jgi:hypothetical protein